MKHMYQVTTARGVKWDGDSQTRPAAVTHIVAVAHIHSHNSAIRGATVEGAVEARLPRDMPVVSGLSDKADVRPTAALALAARAVLLLLCCCCCCWTVSSTRPGHPPPPGARPRLGPAHQQRERPLLHPHDQQRNVQGTRGYRAHTRGGPPLLSLSLSLLPLSLPVTPEGPSLV